jgi:hypothetical protein
MEVRTNRSPRLKRQRTHQHPRRKTSTRGSLARSFLFNGRFLTITDAQRPPSPVKHVAAEDSAEAGEIPAEEEAPKSKFAPIQWVAPVPAAKAAAPETNGKAAEAEAAASDGEASGGADKPVSEMTEVEKILARAKKYGTPVDEKLLAAAKLAERAKRFNIEPVAATKGALIPRCRNFEFVANTLSVFRSWKDIATERWSRQVRRGRGIIEETRREVSNVESHSRENLGFRWVIDLLSLVAFTPI